MPNFDQTGPAGEGKMTGRKFGPCTPKAPKTFCGGGGRGRGRGGRRGFAARSVRND